MIWVARRFSRAICIVKNPVANPDINAATTAISAISGAIGGTSGAVTVTSTGNLTAGTGIVAQSGTAPATTGAVSVASIGDIPFYRTQRREVFQNCGRVDPKRIEDAIALVLESVKAPRA